MILCAKYNAVCPAKKQLQGKLTRMPRIFDNIEQPFSQALINTLSDFKSADFCVGYFNLRGWRFLDSKIDEWTGSDDNCCRLLVGMQKLPSEELRELSRNNGLMDNQTAIRLKRKMAEEFRNQLTWGVPTNQDEIGLRKLAQQIKLKKVRVKLFLQYPLHAKLYILSRPDYTNPKISFLGSSNLTFSGLNTQGELNIDVTDQDACQKLTNWFNARWEDRWCIDISQDLLEIINNSWAREIPLPPYYIYLKMAYHLSMEAQEGIASFNITDEFKNKLFDYQIKAVQIASHHLNKRGGVLLGDVVGLGKTMMATAIARIFEEMRYQTLIICPKNLVPMWEDYRYQYRLAGAEILSLSMTDKLADMRRYTLVIIDESHNLRNREGSRYKAIQEYIQKNDSKVILLSATPYNKSYLDLSSQLRLFIEEDYDLGIRPEKAIKEIGEIEFLRKHQVSLRSIKAFEKSDKPDDWRELMRLYMVRRTRTFIKNNYAKKDETNNLYYILQNDGTRSYFPERIPKTVKFALNGKKNSDQYSLLYSESVVEAINSLDLPRYGLGNYQRIDPQNPPASEAQAIIADLSRAGKRLMGFCRTSLFKRLESSGYSFLLSLKHHLLRNEIYLYALENNLPLPIGSQDVYYKDDSTTDKEMEELELEENGDNGSSANNGDDNQLTAEEHYKVYSTKYKKKFRWLDARYFNPDLAKALKKDNKIIKKILNDVGEWKAEQDRKLKALLELITEKHPQNKILIFSQFADTVTYLAKELANRKVDKLDKVTGDTENPTGIVHHFSPVSNNCREKIKPENELRIIITTDVLSEGQNLQDANIIVNYDLPWAIIRLIQRAGRVDRIGQKASKIFCYSFLPEDGVEKIIKLRVRVKHRLFENDEVVGGDESFFEDEPNHSAILDLYNEKSGILDENEDGEIDLASYAYQIWKNALDKNPELKKIIPGLANVSYSTRYLKKKESQNEGVLVYLRTGSGIDSLGRIDKDGKMVSESPLEVLKAAECKENTEACERLENHHTLVNNAIEAMTQEENNTGGQLGSPRGARFKVYERLKNYLQSQQDTLFYDETLKKTLEEIYQYPLRQSAIDILNRQLKLGLTDEQLAELVIKLREKDKLCVIESEIESHEHQLICSMGLRKLDYGETEDHE